MDGERSRRRPLTYGVVYSADDGDTWLDVAIDLEETRAEIPAEFLALGTEHVVRVMATDGVDSVEAERVLGPRAPPGPRTLPGGSEDAGGEASAPAPGAGAVLVAIVIVAVALVRRR